MVIVRLIGGVGNQMFQYALGRSLSLRNKTELKLDITGFESYKLHKYSLDAFNIRKNMASKNEIDGFKKYKTKPGKRWFLYNKFIANSSKYFQEKDSNFDPDVMKLNGDVYIDGYWQSEKYFKPIESIIRKEFKLRDINRKRLNPTLSRIYNTNSVSLHIRRTDYLADKNQKTYTRISLDYYKEAINKIGDICNGLNLFVFSDDIKWAKDNLKIPSDIPLRFVSGIGLTNTEELFLISQCKHNITSNSTFSWWGAWLNENQEKIVITPKKWFVDINKNEEDLIPATWIKI